MTIADFDGRDFVGAKLALFMGPHLVVLLRDDRQGLAYPGMWDFPGGGREPDETPVACVLRETTEEIGLRLAPQDLLWGRGFEAKGRRGWLFLARQPFRRLGAIRFGSEGQGWRLMSPCAYLAHPRGIPLLKHRLTTARAALGQT